MTANVTDNARSISSLSSLRDGFLVFTVLAFIALFNIGLHWEIENITKRSIDLKAARILQLDEAQIDRIQAIHTAYDLELIRLKNERNFVGHEKIEQLQKKRDKEILGVLDGNQQLRLYRHYKDFANVTQMLDGDLMQ
jgi:hypothetical protein